MNVRTLEHKNRPRRGLAVAATVAASLLLLVGKSPLADDWKSYTDARVDKQVSAYEARRAAYRYLRDLGYSRRVGPGSAQVRSITRDGDTWIIRVALSNGGAVRSERAMLYVDATTALVSEVPPTNKPSAVASE